MAHQRTEIREAVMALLVGANTAAAARVQDTQVDPHKKGALPALAVYTLTDPVDEDLSSQLEEAHELELEIAGWVAHTEAVSAPKAMDALALQVELAMRGDPWLGGKASKVTLKGTEMEIAEVNGGSSPLVGIFAMTYAVEYRTDVTTAIATDDFRTADVTTELVGGVNDTVPAEDTFTVQETPP